MTNYVYILTDINRRSLHVGTTQNLSDTVNTYREMYSLFFDSDTRISRLVYHEAFTTEEAAIQRFEELKRYTRMQKERLIRKHNPDWVDISLLNYPKPLGKTTERLAY